MPKNHIPKGLQEIIPELREVGHIVDTCGLPISSEARSKIGRLLHHADRRPRLAAMCSDVAPTLQPVVRILSKDPDKPYKPPENPNHNSALHHALSDATGILGHLICWGPDMPKPSETSLGRALGHKGKSLDLPDRPGQRIIALADRIAELCGFGHGTLAKDDVEATKGTSAVAMGKQKGQTTPELDADETTECRRSPDFRFVNWYGTEYTFTKGQAACVAQWWAAWHKKTPDLEDTEVLREAHSQGKIRWVFRVKDKTGKMLPHPAWGTMIVEGATKGTHRLTEPHV